MCYAGQTPAVLSSYLDYTKQTFLFPLSESWPFPNNADQLLVMVRQVAHLGAAHKSPRPLHTYSSGSDSKCWQTPSWRVRLRNLKITLWCLALILSVHFVKSKTKSIELQTRKCKQWKEMMETLWFLSPLEQCSFSEGGLSDSPPLPTP